jgi:hypothetical protein
MNHIGLYFGFKIWLAAYRLAACRWSNNATDFVRVLPLSVPCVGGLNIIRPVDPEGEVYTSFHLLIR